MELGRGPHVRDEVPQNWPEVGPRLQWRSRLGTPESEATVRWSPLVPQSHPRHLKISPNCLARPGPRHYGPAAVTSGCSEEAQASSGMFKQPVQAKPGGQKNGSNPQASFSHRF